MEEREIRRGDIYYADLSPVVGSRQGGVRPVLVIQNNTGNTYSPTVIVAAVTSQPKTKLPDACDTERHEGVGEKFRGTFWNRCGQLIKVG